VGGLRSGVDDSWILAKEQDVTIYFVGLICFAVAEGLCFGYEYGKKRVSDSGVPGDGNYISGSVVSISVFKEERLFRDDAVREK
jgi:hypothetical protein